MNAEEDYGFDVYGYLHMSQVLTPTEVAACSQAVSGSGLEGAPSRSILTAMGEQPALEQRPAESGEHHGSRQVNIREAAATTSRWSSS